MSATRLTIVLFHLSRKRLLVNTDLSHGVTVVVFTCTQERSEIANARSRKATTRRVALEFRVVGGAAVKHTADIRMHDEFANALARDAHGHVHKNAVEGLQLCRPSSCVPFLAFDDPSVLSEHAEVEAVVNAVDSYERRVALEWFVAKRRPQALSNLGRLSQPKF